MDSAIAAAWEKVFAEDHVEDFDGYKAEGWMSATDFGKRIGISSEAALKRLKRRAENGELDQKKIRVQVNSTPQQIWIYRPRI